MQIDDAFLMFRLDDVPYSIIVPERYPDAGADYYGPGSVSGKLKKGNLEAMVRELSRLENAPVVSMSREESALSDEIFHNGDAFDEVERDADRLKHHPHVLNVTTFRTQSVVTRWQVSLNRLVSANTGGAWGIAMDHPIDVQLTAPSFYMGSSEPPQIRITQKDAAFPYGQQMGRILKEYLRVHWADKSFPRVAPTSTAEQPPLSKRPRQEKPEVSPNPKVFLALAEMGYCAEEASAAARRCTNVDSAIEWLHAQQSRASPGRTRDDEDEDIHSEAGNEVIQALSIDDPDPGSDPNKVVVFQSEKGLMYHLVDVMLHRTRTLSQYCVLCDKPHRFTKAMIRPAVCCREMCVFQFQELKLGTDAAECIATPPGVIDLLLVIFKCAAMSTRGDSVMNPYPSVADPSSSCRSKATLALDPSKPDYDKLRRLAELLPSTREVVQCNNLESLRVSLDRVERLTFPLLEWIINSNRSYLVQLEPAHQLQRMKAEYQFLLLMASPEKEAVFRKGKEKYGTKFAFHGSRAENWHSILRVGLRNLSGTKDQLNGNAHGNGIYFACDANVSCGYSSKQMGTVRTEARKRDAYAYIDGSEMMCVALCEIVNDGCIKDHNWCWTVEKEENVMTRFLFVYRTGSSVPGSNEATTTNADFQNEIKRTMAHFNIA